MLCRSLRQKSRLSGGQVNYREEEKRILDSILGRDVYDNRIRPSGLNGTGNAVFSIHLDFLSTLNALQMRPPSSLSTCTFVASPKLTT